jgi:hypothetical protein
MPKRQPLIFLGVSFIATLSVAGIIFAFAGGPPTGATGSAIFKQPSCSQSSCHVGMVVNSPNGSLTLTGVPGSFTLGQSYDLNITINQPTNAVGVSRFPRARTAGLRLALQALGGFSQLRALGTPLSVHGPHRSGYTRRHQPVT